MVFPCRHFGAFASAVKGREAKAMAFGLSCSLIGEIPSVKRPLLVSVS